MKLIVGLGNPGSEYQFTPHNLGFLAIDRIAEQCGIRVANRNCRALTGRARIGDMEVLLAKPETYMNLSGMSVRDLVDEYEADPVRDLIVIYDELALPWGHIRIRERGSSGGHNGIQSILGTLGTAEITRVRLGIGPDYPVEDGARYVLSQLKKPQLAIVDQMLDTAAEAVRMILSEGPGSAMARFNRKAETGSSEENAGAAKE